MKKKYVVLFGCLLITIVTIVGWLFSVENLERSAYLGDAISQYDLAKNYLNESDYPNAFKWAEKAATKGNADAQIVLCALYYEGEGVEQDYSKAFEWCEKSANQGNIHASFNLALMYLRGNGVEHDVDIATELFGKACDNRIQDGCDEYKRLNSLKTTTVFIPNKVNSYEPEKVFIPNEIESYEAELRVIQRQEQAELNEAEYRSDLAEIEAGQAEIRSIMRQAELLD